ncbi:MAG: hypothetical protein ACQESF_04695 [Nanobdellota archaeon]
MEIKKKGMFFTIMAMSIVTLMVIGFTGTHKLKNIKDTKVLEAEFSLLNTHKKNIENFCENVLLIQTKHAIRDMIDYIEAGGSIDDTNKRFSELVINAELYGNKGNAPHMGNLNFDNWTRTMSKKSHNFLGINTSIKLENPRLQQDSPWRITALADLKINATLKNLSYKIDKTISTSHSILEYKDPLYLYHGAVNKIHIAAIPFYNEEETYDMLKNRSYRHAGMGPSFIMRLEENYSKSVCCGIQSFINSSFVTSPADKEKSYVDFLFWSGKRTCSNGKHPLYNFTMLSNTPEGKGFKLDNTYMNLYGMNLSNTPGSPYCTP